MLKKYVFVLLLISIPFLHSQERAKTYALGEGSYVFDIGYSRLNNQQNGLLLDFLGYGRAFHNLYLGGGVAVNLYFIDLGISEEVPTTFLHPIYTMLEGNVKYAIPFNKFVILELGIGPSFAFTTDIKPLLNSAGLMMGFQAFSKLTFKVGKFIFGANIKYYQQHAFYSDAISSILTTGIHLGYAN